MLELLAIIPMDMVLLTALVQVFAGAGGLNAGRFTAAPPYRFADSRDTGPGPAWASFPRGL